MFSKEKSKQRVLSDVFKNNPVLVIGYSGGDKVDVMPLLFSVESKYPIVWIQHAKPSSSAIPKELLTFLHNVKTRRETEGYVRDVIIIKNETDRIRKDLEALKLDGYSSYKASKIERTYNDINKETTLYFSEWRDRFFSKLWKISSFISRYYYQLAELELAISYGEDAMKLLPLADKNSKNYASLCHNLGLALVRSDPNKAISYLELALERFSNLGDHLHASTAATNIAAFLGHQDPKKAEKYCKIAMDYMEKAKNRMKSTSVSR